MPSVALEPAIPTVEVLQTYALDRAATGVGMHEPYTSRIFLTYTPSLTL